MVYAVVPQIGTLKREWDTISLYILFVDLKLLSNEGRTKAVVSIQDLMKRINHTTQVITLHDNVPNVYGVKTEAEMISGSPPGWPCSIYCKSSFYMGLLTTSDPFGAADQLAPPSFRSSLHRVVILIT
ncbi:hypothetical protein [Absidia glauca]|uniref:Uncharacterized protein n=1 Tax=Absidia glauca TaxID=4829 RepID=A0A163J6X6_ABSGL|nr:hypothetical protein [Absidia glauca]